LPSWHGGGCPFGGLGIDKAGGNELCGVFHDLGCEANVHFGAVVVVVGFEDAVVCVGWDAKGPGGGCQ